MKVAERAFSAFILAVTVLVIFPTAPSGATSPYDGTYRTSDTIVLSRDSESHDITTKFMAFFDRSGVILKNGQTFGEFEGT